MPATKTRDPALRERMARRCFHEMVGRREAHTKAFGFVTFWTTAKTGTLPDLVHYLVLIMVLFLLFFYFGICIHWRSGTTDSIEDYGVEKIRSDYIPGFAW
jgi:hypothetical protein